MSIATHPQFDAEKYLALENNNVGHNIVVNPQYYRHIAQALVESPTRYVNIVDAGGGSGNMAREILYGNLTKVPALKINARLIQQARRKIGDVFVLDADRESLEWGELLYEDQKTKAKQKIGTVHFQHADLADTTKQYPIEKGDARIVASRQFLMYLKNPGLAHFAEEVDRITDENGVHISAFLNPDYQFAKFAEKNPQATKPESGELLAFPSHVTATDTRDFPHIYRPLGDTLNILQETRMKLQECNALMPISNAHRASHERYYGPHAMAYLVETRKKLRDQTEELVN